MKKTYEKPRLVPVATLSKFTSKISFEPEVNPF